MCGGPAGLASHVRSMHRNEFDEEVAAAEARNGREVPPAAQPAANGLVWEDPAPRGKRNQAIETITALIPELRRNPNKWARLYTWPNHSSAGSTRSILTKMPGLDDIEFAGRVTGRSNGTGGTSALYGRFTGE